MLWLGVTTAALATGDTPPPSITSLSVANGQVTVSWTNGVPSYQLQKSASPWQGWENVGSPTNAMSLTFPQTSEQAYF